MLESFNLKPKKIHDEERASDIIKAIDYNKTNSISIPKEWIRELQDLYDSGINI